MTVQIEKELETSFSFPEDDYIEKVVAAAVAYVGCPYETSVDVLLTDNDRIRELNRDYRGIDRPTDVLSFPMVEYEQAGNFDFLEESPSDWFHPETGELLLGDIVLSCDQIRAQAEEYGHSELRELCFLVAHSMLHLFGYDHEEESERERMEEMQREILENIGISRENRQASDGNDLGES